MYYCSATILLQTPVLFNKLAKLRGALTMYVYLISSMSHGISGIIMVCAYVGFKLLACEHLIILQIVLEMHCHLVMSIHCWGCVSFDENAAGKLRKKV